MLCESFIYGGCLGNDNRFATEEECLDSCKPKIQHYGRVGHKDPTGKTQGRHFIDAGFLDEHHPEPFIDHTVSKDKAHDKLYGDSPGGHESKLYIEHRAPKDKTRRKLYFGLDFHRGFDSSKSHVEHRTPNAKGMGLTKDENSKLYINHIMPKDKTERKPYIDIGLPGDDNSKPYIDHITPNDYTEGKPYIDIGLPKDDNPKPYIDHRTSNDNTEGKPYIDIGLPKDDDSKPYIDHRAPKDNRHGKHKKMTGSRPNGNRNGHSDNIHRRNANICLAKPDPGDCLGYFRSYYWDSTLRRCEVFAYGGCGGNGNNFDTKEACEAACKPRIDPRNDGNVFQAPVKALLLSITAYFWFKQFYI